MAEERINGVASG